MATLYLLRHVKAGDRNAWTGPDRIRPISKPGHRQAEALIDQYAGWALDRVVASPYVRCVQSVEPLAKARGLPVESAAYLAEGASWSEVAGALASVDGATVWCTHGDVGTLVLDHLEASGVELGHSAPFAKGSTWRIELVDGSPTSAAYVPPPA